MPRTSFSSESVKSAIVTWLVASANCQQRSLVDQVLQVGADHARGRGGQGVQVDAGRQRDSPACAPGGSGARPRWSGGRYRHPPVEAARAQQRRVEDLGPVGRRQDDDAFIAGEAVHLGEDLVEGLLALVVATRSTRHRPGPGRWRPARR